MTIVVCVTVCVVFPPTIMYRFWKKRKKKYPQQQLLLLLNI